MSNLVFSGKAVFPDGEDAIGSRVFLTNKARKKLFSPPKGAAIVDATGNWSITVPKADLIKIPGQKMIYAISSEDGRTWREFIKAGQKYDSDFKDAIGDTELDEVVITAGPNKKKTECEAKGGKYIPSGRDKEGRYVSSQCIMPSTRQPEKELSWWDKNKLWVYIGGSLLFVTITTAVIVYANKKKKGKK